MKSIETKEAEALGHLHMARAALLEAKDDLRRGSRELAVALTETDTAILWLQKDMQLKEPILNECAPEKVEKDKHPAKCEHRFYKNDRTLHMQCSLCGASYPASPRT